MGTQISPGLFSKYSLQPHKHNPQTHLVITHTKFVFQPNQPSYFFPTQINPGVFSKYLMQLHKPILLSFISCKNCLPTQINPGLLPQILAAATLMNPQTHL